MTYKYLRHSDSALLRFRGTPRHGCLDWLGGERRCSSFVPRKIYQLLSSVTPCPSTDCYCSLPAPVPSISHTDRLGEVFVSVGFPDSPVSLSPLLGHFCGKPRGSSPTSGRVVASWADVPPISVPDRKHAGHRNTTVTAELARP
jgi:hypothetical protein